MRLRNVKNKEEIMNESTYLVKEPFIINNALKYPNINFIGIEKFDSVVVRGLQKIPEGLDNLLIIRMDALDIDKVFEKEISRIYLNFSDPWPKKRHSLRRLSSKVFIYAN